MDDPAPGARLLARVSTDQSDCNTQRPDAGLHLRGATDGIAAPVGSQTPPLPQAIKTLWSLRAFRHATFAGALIDFTLYATLNWNAPFYNRTFGLSGSDLAGHMALLSGVGSGLGVYFGGRIADQLARRDERWYLWTPALAAILAVPCMCVQYFTTQSNVSLLAGYLPAVLLSCFLAPLIATAQLLVPANLRAFTSAVLALGNRTTILWHPALDQFEPTSPPPGPPATRQQPTA
jgi:hypothetical protein